MLHCGKCLLLDQLLLPSMRRRSTVRLVFPLPCLQRHIIGAVHVRRVVPMTRNSSAAVIASSRAATSSPCPI